MNSIVVVLLIVGWASIFVPGIVRVRRGAPTPVARQPAGSEGEPRPAPGSPLAPIPPSTLARRRLLFAGLLVTTVVAAPVATLAGGIADWVLLAASLGLLVDVAVLAQSRARREALRRKLRFLEVPKGDLPPGAGHAAERLPRSEQEADSATQRRRA